MAKRKVLFVAHNHPSVHPGGAQQYAYEIFRAFRDSSEFEPLLLARTDIPASHSAEPHPGTPFTTVEGEADQYFLFTNSESYDWIYESSRDKRLYTQHIADFLLAHRPDIVHLQHTTEIGYDLIRQIHNTLPAAPILYTLHEYMPICLEHGQMVRTTDNSLCESASPFRCHECFPQIAPETFFLRQRFIQKQFGLVDLFLAPSHFLRERFIDWGIPPERIVYEEHGRPMSAPLKIPIADRPRNRFGFFGQITPFKGMDVLLQAMLCLKNGAGSNAQGPHLWLHGANLHTQNEAFQARFRELLSQVDDNVTFVGQYDQSQLPELMAAIDWVIVPSTWWENAPLVIQEAFMHKRPVICSNIGGMAEKVADDVNGLHFPVGSPGALAETMSRAATTPGLWDRLRAQIPPVYSIAEAVDSLSMIYRSLLETGLADNPRDSAPLPQRAGT
jgi:glycosyltransferase involved in cell wall biosynthesis